MSDRGRFFWLEEVQDLHSSQLEFVPRPVDDADEGLAGLDEIQGRGDPDWRKCR